MNNQDLFDLLKKHRLHFSTVLHSSIPPHKPGKILFLSDNFCVLHVIADEETPIGVDPREFALIAPVGISGVVIEIGLDSTNKRSALGELVGDLARAKTTLVGIDKIVYVLDRLVSEVSKMRR